MWAIVLLIVGVLMFLVLRLVVDKETLRNFSFLLKVSFILLAVFVLFSLFISLTQ